MTKYICDRCGNSDSAIELPVLKLTQFVGFNQSDDKDICYSCLKELRQWLEPSSPPAKTPQHIS